MVIFQAFDTADGQIIVAAANDRLFAKFAGALGHPEWAQDARFKTNADRFANKARLIPMVRRHHALAARRAEWVERLDAVAVPSAAINDIAHMKAHPQTAALGMVQPVPDVGLDLMSLPLSFEGRRPPIRTRAPKLGEHNDDVRGSASVKRE